MNPIGKIVVYFLGVALLGALLSPPLFWGVQKLQPWAESHGWLHYKPVKEDSVKEGDVEPAPAARGEAEGALDFLDADFGKVSNRAMLLAALLLLWPVFRWVNVRSASELGLERNPERWRHFAIGYAVAVVMMAVLGVLLVQQGVYRMKNTPPWAELFTAALSGFGAGIVEELVFRGAFLGLFRKSLNQWTALASVSALYSIVHFLKPPEAVIAAQDVNWLSGFTILGERFVNFSNPALLLGGFSTLFLLGWILGWTVLRTRSLWLGIGIHAGIVLGKFGFGRLTKRNKDMRDLLPWIGSDMVVGVVALVTVALIGLVVWLIFKYGPARTRKTVR